ncbi:MAG: iron-containing alcohol dehydrogenase [Actinomycetota bacterium]|nr:iron-containing alcohol dehydrogenase [Actinomycetota bacterium]
MENFEYQNSTRIVFGKDSDGKLGSLVKEYGTKVLLHYGGGSIKENGIYDRVIKTLRAGDISVVELPGVRPNPILGLVQEGIDICRRQKIDFILAVGGGSVIDSAKAIAAGVHYEGSLWDFFEGKASPRKVPPVGVVLTIPAAGSESSDVTVITKEEGLIKRGYHNHLLRPKFAILNPEFTYTLPAFQTAAGAADIMAHVMERYFTHTRNVDLTDRLCESTLKTVIKHTPLALENPRDYNARAEIMWAGTIAHNGILGTGREEDWGSHKIGHELSAIYGLTHGASLAIVFPAWLKYTYKQNLPLMAQFAFRVFEIEIDYNNLEQTAVKGIGSLEKFFKDIGLPVKLSEAQIGNQRWKEMAAKCTATGPKGNFIKMYDQDIINILEIAR